MLTELLATTPAPTMQALVIPASILSSARILLDGANCWPTKGLKNGHGCRFSDGSVTAGISGGGMTDVNAVAGTALLKL
jgi:hypothetical protein